MSKAALTSMIPGVVRDAEAKNRSDEVMYEVLAFKLASETYALPLAGVQALVDFMKDFAKRNG